MVNRMNLGSQRKGLAFLLLDMGLERVARTKAKDILDRSYFSHQSPTYGSPFDMVRAFGVSYRAAGENIAGDQTVSAAHQSLMNSPGRRANILDLS